MINSVSATAIFLNCFASTNAQFVNFNAAGSTTLVNSGFQIATGTEFASGASGTLIYGGLSILGSATGIAPGLTQVIANSIPRATAGSSTTTRGASAFDSSQFSVTDGFVSLVGATGLIKEVITASQALEVNHGYYVTSGTVSLSLPTTSSVGDTIAVSLATVTGGNSWTITQGAGQQIYVAQFPSTLGVTGNATSGSASCSVTLECIVANTIWMATSVVGTINTA